MTPRFAVALSASLIPAISAAGDGPHSFAGKVALYSEYEYRGIAQTSERAALQLGLDYARPSGLYVGTFISNISWLKDTAEALGDSISARSEWDIYGGYKWDLVKDWTADVGYLRYEYPSSKPLVYGSGQFVSGTALLKPDTDELYASISYGSARLKYSYAFSELFGVPGSKGSDYLELSFDQQLIKGRLTLNAVLGHQRYKGTQAPPCCTPGFGGRFDNSLFDYTVWKVGVTYAFGGGWTASGYCKGTNADPSYFTLKGVDSGADRVVAGVAWSF